MSHNMYLVSPGTILQMSHNKDRYETRFIPGGTSGTATGEVAAEELPELVGGHFVLACTSGDSLT